MISVINPRDLQQFHNPKRIEKIRRTPEAAFYGVREAQGHGNYAYIHYKGQSLRMHYVDEGQRNGKVLLCLHGEPFWSQSYRRLIPYLNENYRIIAPDFIGFGRSDKLVDWRSYDLELHEETIVQLLRHLNGKRIICPLSESDLV